jgi:hypothetical protein
VSSRDPDDPGSDLSPHDKRRYYLSARGSATESAALLDVLSRLGLLDETGHQAGKEMLVRVAIPLVVTVRLQCQA